MAKEHTYWIVRDPDPTIGCLAWTCAVTQSESVAKLVYQFGGRWEKHYGAGYRCIKVRLVEVKHA